MPTLDEQLEELREALKSPAEASTASVSLGQRYPNTITGGGYTVGQGLTINGGTGTTSLWSASNTAATGNINAKDFILDGVSLKQLLEERLNMLVPNPELEREWNELKELGNKYRELEADLKEKAKIWQALNKKS